MRRGIVTGTLLALLALAFGARAMPATAVPVRAVQVPEHRAVVVVDTGSVVRHACIRFSADSISGTEALQLAGMSPVFRTFGGQGAAVCSLCGQGCPADGSCLTCGGASYWGYFRAPAGTSGFRYSGAGASSTRVRDGDVEGWRWGNGSSPPTYVSVEQYCGPVPVVVPSSIVAPLVTTPATTVPAVGGTTLAGGATTTTLIPAVSSPGSATGPASPGVVNSAATRAGAAPKVASQTGGSPMVLLIVGGVILAAVVAMVWWNRRRIGARP